MTDAANLPETLQALPVRLRAELHSLRCADEARAEERERYRPAPLMADWVDLLDELEIGGPLMREVVRDSLEALQSPPIYGEWRMPSALAGFIFAGSRAGRAAPHPPAGR